MRRACLLAVFLLGCGGDDTGDDEPVDIDARVEEPPDAEPPPDGPPPPPEGPLGSACTAAQEPPVQGDCPDGFLCVERLQGSGPWCTKTCTSFGDGTCDDGYQGPGIPECFYDFEGGGKFCGVMCRDADGGPDWCPGCDDTCPDDHLACDAPITGNDVPIAYGCE
jgi:hypothetical protein